MKRVPADIDQLMWTIAESADVAAADDFERRFPEWKPELESRMAMVRGLRHARPPVVAPTPVIPKFVPRATPSPAPRRLGWVTALSATAVIAFGSFLWVSLNPPPPPADPSSQGEQLNPPGPPAAGMPEQVNPDDPQAAQSTSPSGQPTVPPPTERVIMPWEHRHDLSIADASLVDVLNLIGDITKLKIEIAPGMPNPMINVSYTQRTGMEMLVDLGREYGFTPLEQARGSVLIVPAVEQTGG
ncbi:MAG: hypothetical protein IT363_12340 [Methanoregulaceae archaeon]|nr:hypothetical protein [Methanoregulaceae archaeon]